MSCNFTEFLCDATTGDPVLVTGLVDPITGGFAIGPVFTNADGTPYTNGVSNLEPCTTSVTGGGGSFACADLASCSIEALGDVGSFAPGNGDVLTWNGSQWVAATPTGGGGVDGVVTNVTLSGTSLVFTGSNGGFNGTIDLSSLGGGGIETLTSLVVNPNGTATYTDELGNPTVFGTQDTESLSIVHRDLVTQVSCSNNDIFHKDIEIYCVAVTADTAPSANENWNLIDRGPTGAGTAQIASGTLTTGSITTGLINITPYVLNAGDLLQSNILSAAGSEKFMLKVFYRELASELG